MRCPDDGQALAETSPGVSACPRCRGRLVSRAGHAAVSPALEALLSEERDPRSGAFARVRDCPGCGRAMLPLRIGTDLAWIDGCRACGLFWVERLDQAVVDRLERSRRARERMATLSPRERAELASDLAGLEREKAGLERDLELAEELMLAVYDLPLP